jgi:hypothetical protein
MAASHLTTKLITITNANGTTFTRKQRVRADSVENTEATSKLSVTPKLTVRKTDSPGRQRAVEMANEMIAKMPKSYDLIGNDGPVEMSVATLELYMEGQLSESSYDDDYNEIADEKVETIIEGLAEDYSPEEWDTFIDNDGRILVIEEIHSRADKQKAIRKSLEEMENNGFAADTEVVIGGGLELNDEEAKVEAMSLSTSLGLSPADFSRNQEALTTFVQDNPGGEVLVFWEEQPAEFIDKWDTEEGFFNITDPILYTRDHGYGMNPDSAVQLVGSEISVKRNLVKPDESTIQYNFDAGVMVDGIDPVPTGKSSTSAEYKRFTQDSDPLF